MPTHAYTQVSIHKSQGMSLDHAVIDFQGTFDDGQAYTALSRVHRQPAAQAPADGQPKVQAVVRRAAARAMGVGVACTDVRQYGSTAVGIACLHGRAGLFNGLFKCT